MEKCTRAPLAGNFVQLQEINLWLYTRKNAQVITNLQQISSNAVPNNLSSGCDALLVPSLLIDNLLQGC
jgi:hypothetical protein